MKVKINLHLRVESIFFLGLLAIFCCFSTLYSIGEKPIVVITASYNNKDVYKKNLCSLFNQEYDNWRQIYIDDCSQDGTADLVEAYIREQQQENRVALIRNAVRHNQLYNQYYAIHSCPKDVIIVILDGDDWLAHSSVLSHVNQVYQTGDVWLTYGQYIFSSTRYIGHCVPLPPDISPENPVRTFRWVASHLRTFYAGLYQCISLEDLQHEGGFFPVCADLATMFPMIEMAGKDHVRFIESILYVYNDDDPSLRCDKIQQLELERIIRSKPPYASLEIPPFLPD